MSLADWAECEHCGEFVGACMGNCIKKGICVTCNKRVKNCICFRCSECSGLAPSPACLCALCKLDAEDYPTCKACCLKRNRNFKTELAYFIANQEELVAKYDGKVLVLQGESVLGVYDTTLDAYLETKKQHELGTFMIQPCIAGKDAYTVSVY